MAVYLVVNRPRVLDNLAAIKEETGDRIQYTSVTAWVIEADNPELAASRIYDDTSEVVVFPLIEES